MGESQEPLLSPNASDYELLAELGQSTGTYGNVALVRHVPSTAVLSAKRYELDRLTSEEAELIQQEVILARQLSHPNILPCLASFVWDQSVCILSPLMDLGSCRDLINNHFPTGLPELAIAFILRDTLHGLDYIHRQGFIHRSIRASHLLVSGGGRVRISGLRYACSLVQHGRWQRTVHEFPASTLTNLNWLSPELLEQNLLGYSEKSDMYSVGITTCEMANGVVPYGDMPAMLMLTEKLGGRAPQLLDKFAFPFIDNNPDGCQADSGVGGSVESGAEVGGLSAVESREFSEPFHYLVELCLERQPDKRPSPARLLTHPFFKQCKRGPLLSLTSVITPALRLRASAASSHDDMLTDTAAERFSDLQLSSVEWDF